MLVMVMVVLVTSMMMVMKVGGDVDHPCNALTAIVAARLLKCCVRAQRCLSWGWCRLCLSSPEYSSKSSCVALHHRIRYCRVRWRWGGAYSDRVWRCTWAHVLMDVCSVSGFSTDPFVGFTLAFIPCVHDTVRRGVNACAYVCGHGCGICVYLSVMMHYTPHVRLYRYPHNRRFIAHVQTLAHTQKCIFHTTMTAIHHHSNLMYQQCPSPRDR